MKMMRVMDIFYMVKIKEKKWLCARKNELATDIIAYFKEHGKIEEITTMVVLEINTFSDAWKGRVITNNIGWKIVEELCIRE